MTESVRRREFSPTRAPVDPVGAGPERRMGRWDGDHLRDGGMTPGADVVDLVATGVEPADLSDDDLLREMHSLHHTRLDTLRYATDAALSSHLRRTAELETEYLVRYPGREVDPRRLGDGA